MGKTRFILREPYVTSDPREMSITDIVELDDRADAKKTRRNVMKTLGYFADKLMSPGFEDASLEVLRIPE